ncbi:type II/IV secretion system protein [bacterium]|nr:type II/IV secretion system protein [bacterium]
MKLINELLKRNLISQEQATSLQEEVELYGKKPEKIIVEKNLVPEETLFTIKSEVFNVPIKKIESQQISSDVLGLIPKDSANYYKMVPIRREDNVVEVGMVYPEDIKAQEALKFLARQQNFKTKIYLITLSDFKNVLRQYSTFKGEIKDALQELENELQPIKTRRSIEELPKGYEEIRKRMVDAPVIKMVAVILRHAVEGKASDVHIEPLKTKTRVRFRVDGVLHSSLLLPKKVHSSLVVRIKVISGLKIDETRIPQDGRFSVIIDGQNIDFRVSTFPTMHGEKVVMRVLNPAERIKTLEELGMASYSLALVKKALKKPYGIILATGPTGCGKTTTLYVTIEFLNKEGVNIVTLEDPIEFYIEGVSQSQIKPEIGYNFANGLRHILRQDPDIIMVGEIRDPETAELATHAALTGHIVLSTLHTNNAIGVIPRLIDLGVKPFLLPSTINIAIAQRLVRRVCPHCKKRIRPQGKMLDLILDEIKKMPPAVRKELPKDLWVWKGEGCVECGHSGYSGRIGIFEVLKMTKQLEKIILTQPTEEKIQKEVKKQGMITMRQDGIIKALKGLTTIEEVIRVTEEQI